MGDRLADLSSSGRRSYCPASANEGTASDLGISFLRDRFMPSTIQTVLDNVAANTRRKIGGIYIGLVVFNLAAWAWALVAFRHYPTLVGTAFLAYSLGLRHAVDADHIAAIDNVTRKLMQEGKRPVGVGLMFSLGHSTIVVLGSAAIAATALSLQHRMDAVRHIGGLVGTLTSTLFLFGIAIVNLVVLRSVYLAFRRVRRGERYVEEDFDLLLGSRGFLSRLFRPMFAMISEAGTCIRLVCCLALGLIRRRRLDFLGFRRQRLRRVCRSGRSWCFRRSLPRA